MDVTDIKAQNIKKILNVLRASSGATKAEITAATSLSFSTVSNLCNELKDKGVLAEEKINNFSVGRMPSIQIFNYEGYGSICIDFQQAGILNFSILNFANKRLYQAHFDISRIRDVSYLLDLVQHTYYSTIRQFTDIQIVGVGISIPGIYDESSNLVLDSSVSIINHVPLKTLLEQRLRLPCHVENEANLCVLSVRQEYPGTRNVVYLHSSSGLGVGVICEGQLLRGRNGYAAEIAHIPIGSPDTQCPYCGSFGCIENDLSQRGMEALSLPSREDNPHLIADKAEKLGILLSVLVNLFDPAIVCIGGRGFAEYEKLQPTVRRILQQRSPLSVGKGLRVLHDTDSLRAIEKGVTQVIYDKWDPMQKS